ncbi:EF-hand domain-containing protein [Sphingomonas bacterium]|uniref:EF-hand domain-containing protein n=1 Tax=Sphingomonas bacterium TaxID=1895847 RepID=UPI0015762F11|nr:EF-hand domain-containing protein [Sphingomonas bacterium]
MKRLILPALAIASILSVPATAQSTRAAALAQLRAEFTATDLDHDGLLTKAEVAARIAHMRMAGAARPLTPQQAHQLTQLWFEHTDTNHDGRVTLAESEATMGQMFDRYDTNHDGVISPAEREAARTAVRPPVAPH